jgi:hypothetical protein
MHLGHTSSPHPSTVPWNLLPAKTNDNFMVAILVFQRESRKASHYAVQNHRLALLFRIATLITPNCICWSRTRPFIALALENRFRRPRWNHSTPLSLNGEHGFGKYEAKDVTPAYASDQLGSSLPSVDSVTRLAQFKPNSRSLAKDWGVWELARGNSCNLEAFAGLDIRWFCYPIRFERDSRLHVPLR